MFRSPATIFIPSDSKFCRTTPNSVSRICGVCKERCTEKTLTLRLSTLMSADKTDRSRLRPPIHTPVIYKARWNISVRTFFCKGSSSYLKDAYPSRGNLLSITRFTRVSPALGLQELVTNIVSIPLIKLYSVRERSMPRNSFETSWRQMMSAFDALRKFKASSRRLLEIKTFQESIRTWFCILPSI